jgi:hypothetical protein
VTDVGHVPPEYLGWDPGHERENRARLRHALTVYCARLPGCPAEHHQDCPRYPPRWATTNYQETAMDDAGKLMSQDEFYRTVPTSYELQQAREDLGIDRYVSDEDQAAALVEDSTGTPAQFYDRGTGEMHTVPAEENAQLEAPEPLFAGTFAIYGEPGGGVVLVVEDRDGKVERKRIPAALVKMGVQAMEGSGMLGRMLKRGS